jgi:Tol biopolymer transport system component
MNADGSGKVQLTKDSKRSCLPNWSPDGTQIVFSYMVSSYGDEAQVERIAIYVTNADGSGLRNVTSTEVLESFSYADYWPMWATDGRIYFYRLYAGNRSAAEFKVKPDGSGLTQQLMQLGSLDQFLKYAVSPDATRVALHDLDTDRLAIHAVNGDGAPVTLLDPVAGYTADHTVDVAWSPDGKALAIAGLFDASEWVTRLMIVNADGTGLSAVPGIDAARDPSWRPE